MKAGLLMLDVLILMSVHIIIGDQKLGNGSTVYIKSEYKLFFLGIIVEMRQPV